MVTVKELTRPLMVMLSLEHDGKLHPATVRKLDSVARLLGAKAGVRARARKGSLASVRSILKQLSAGPKAQAFHRSLSGKSLAEGTRILRALGADGRLGLRIMQAETEPERRTLVDKLWANLIEVHGPASAKRGRGRGRLGVKRAEAYHEAKEEGDPNSWSNFWNWHWRDKLKAVAGTGLGLWMAHTVWNDPWAVLNPYQIAASYAINYALNGHNTYQGPRIEGILAEKKDPSTGKLMFLVKWSGITQPMWFDEDSLVMGRVTPLEGHVRDSPILEILARRGSSGKEQLLVRMEGLQEPVWLPLRRLVLGSIPKPKN